MAKITIHRIFLPFNQMAARISSFSLFFVHIFPHFLFLSSKFVFFREISKQKSEIDTRDDSRVMKPRLGFLISFFFFPTLKEGTERREYGIRIVIDSFLESEIIFRWNAPHLVIAAQTRGRKFNKEQEEVGRSAWLPNPFPFFPLLPKQNSFTLPLAFLLRFVTSPWPNSVLNR